MILDNLYASEISFSIVAEWDAGYRVRLGSEYGIRGDGDCQYVRRGIRAASLGLASLAVVPSAVTVTLRQAHGERSI